MNKPYRLLDVFSGIGAFSLGLERTGGFKTVAFCEVSPYARSVLARHWPSVPCYDDIRTLTAERLAADGIAVDAMCGGFPCQNVSVAAAPHGVDTGIDGDRSGLWFEYDRLIGEIKPKAAFIENVDRLAGRGFDAVLRCLAARGYDAEWDILPGFCVGAPQRRQRIWAAAYPAGERVEGLFQGLDFGAARQGWPGGTADLQHIAGSALVGHAGFPQPLLRGMDDRPADWVERLHALGNAVIPQIPEMIGNAFLRAERLAA